MSETCRVIINQVKQKMHLVGYLLIRYFKDAGYHEHKIIIHLCLGFPSLPFPLGIPTKQPVCISSLSHARHMHCPSRHSWFDHPYNIGEDYISRSSPLWNFLLTLLTSSLLLRSTYFQHHALNILNLWSSLHARDQVSHPYITTGKIRVLYILHFMFVGSRQKDERFRTEGQQTFAEFNLL